MRVGKQLLAAKGPNQKEAECQTKIVDCLLFLLGSLRREMLRLMKMTMTNKLQSQVHVTASQATKDCCSELSLSRPTKALKRKGEMGQFSLYSSYVIRGRTDLEGQPGHISAWAEKCTCHLGIHALYRVYNIFFQ